MYIAKIQWKNSFVLMKFLYNALKYNTLLIIWKICKYYRIRKIIKPLISYKKNRFAARLLVDFSSGCQVVTLTNSCERDRDQSAISSQVTWLTIRSHWLIPRTGLYSLTSFRLPSLNVLYHLTLIICSLLICILD